MNSYSKFSYPLFNDLPQSLKVLYTMVLLILGIGYVFAMIQIFEVHSGRDGKPGLAVQDIQIAYNGSKSDTRLEAAIKGPMNSMLQASEANTIITWVRSGAEQDHFEAEVMPVLEARCLACHDGSNPHIPNLSTFDLVSQLTIMDTGVSIGTLVRVSHIHLFGLTFIFAFMGLIFSHSYVRRQWVKSVVIMIPFVAIILDIMSWWLTKVSEPFAYVVVIGGGLMGLSFAYQWLVSMYQLWFFKCPPGEYCAP